MRRAKQITLNEDSSLKSPILGALRMSCKRVTIALLMNVKCYAGEKYYYGEKCYYGKKLLWCKVLFW